MENINAQFGVEEKLWFEIQQPLLLWMCRHEEGRKLLCMDQTLERVDIIRPNSVSMYLGEGKTKTDFRGHSKWGKLIRHQWTQFQDIADEYVFLMNMGKVPFIAEPVVPAGATSSTFYPAVGAVSPCAGEVTRATDGTWASVRDGAGTAFTVTSELMRVAIGTANATDEWDDTKRCIVMFDTSAITSSDVADSGTLSLMANAKSDTMDPTLSPQVTLGVYGATPAATDTLEAADYQEIGTTEFATPMTYADFTVSSTVYNDITLNAAGVANVDVTGISKYGLREGEYDATVVAPVFGSTFDTAQFVIEAAFGTGTTQDPKLVIVHSTAPITFTPRAIVF